MKDRGQVPAVCKRERDLHISRVHIAGGRQALEGSRSGLELGPGVGMTGAPARESWLRPELAAPVPSFRLSGVCPGVPIVREEEASPSNPWNALVIERRRQETPIFPSPEEFPEQRDGWKGVSVVVQFSGFCHRHPRSEPPSELLH